MFSRAKATDHATQMSKHVEQLESASGERCGNTCAPKAKSGKMWGDLWPFTPRKFLVLPTTCRIQKVDIPRARHTGRNPAFEYETRKVKVLV